MQGVTCSTCGKKNHWSTVCRMRRHSSTGRSPSPGRPQQHRQSRPSSKQFKKGKGGTGNQFNGKKTATPKKPFKPKTHKAFSLTVTEPQLSTPTHPPKVSGAVSKEEMVKQVKPAGLSAPALPPKDAGETFINSFMCDTINSIGNEEYDDCNKTYKVYTDTDSDGKTEIITDINVKFQGRAIEMEVKVDPGAETNCIPLSHFRCLFPELCSNGKPRENALTPTLAQFEAYNGGVMKAHGWTILPTQDITRAKKFHPVRYYILDREDARILISHATASWLGLVEIKCKNKAPKVKYSLNLQIYKIYSTITVIVIPVHPPKGKYFQKLGQHQAVRKTLLGETLMILRNLQLQRGAIQVNRKATVTNLLKHPPKVK